MTSNERRPVTPVDRVMEQFVDEYVALNPIAATTFGISGHDAELPDLSPDGLSDISALRRRTLATLTGTPAADAVDRVTVAAAREQLNAAEAIRATGAEESCLNNIESPVQTIREAFDLMATSTVDDWTTTAARLGQVPDAIDGYVASLRFAAARGDISPRRQVAAAIPQSLANTGTEGFFASLANNASVENGELPQSLRADLRRNAQRAAEAYETLAAFLGEELLPQAPIEDPVGAERYALFARWHLGTSVDLAESYAWGQQELGRITEQMKETSHRIRPGSSIQEAMDHLTGDPSRRLAGTEALRAWMQDTSDRAIAALAGSHFDIPEPIRTLECRIAPTLSLIHI